MKRKKKLERINKNKLELSRTGWLIDEYPNPEKGKEHGKNADFVILDTNFLDYTGDDLKKIHNTKIKDVYFEGKDVFNKK